MVRVSVVGGRSVLSVRGELDLATLPQLHNALAKSASEQPGALVVIDLDGVYACDDAALGVLLGAAGRARDIGGDLRVVCSAGPLRERLSRTGFDRAVEVVATIADIT